MTNYYINFENVKNFMGFHKVIKKSLNFPDYYGENPDAFWDCITCDIIYPASIYITGIDSLPKDLEREVNLTKEVLQEVVDLYKEMQKISKFDHEFNVVYLD